MKNIVSLQKIIYQPLNYNILENSNNNNTSKILSTSPCNQDLFEGHVHENLANVIASEIELDKNCSIIGIDGSWGTGKSNLIGLIGKKLDKKKYYFFTYDAWGHQNDLPRRTILEDLTSYLYGGENSIIKDSTWKNKLNNLLAKKRQTNTTTIPALGAGTICTIVSILLIPLLTYLSSLTTCTCIDIIICIIPFSIYIIVFIQHYKKMRNTYRESYTWSQCISEFFLIYEDKIKEESKYETISEREPSSKQFRDWMNEINQSLSTNNKNLILVFDNMDRLPKLKVQELWAAIHSFFAEQKYSNIKVIVPFDREHIRNAFQSENIKDQQLKDQQLKDQQYDYGDDFINKTFYVVYNVPTPILTGWMAYFREQWKNAFGDKAKVDDSVLQIYDMLTTTQSPRKIISFINQFVTIKKICDSNIKDKYIALYILGRASIIKNPLNEILAPTYLNGLEFLYKNDPNMPESISALYYQLPIKDAMDIVFSQKVTQELNENKLDILKQLKGTEKFWGILSHAITQITILENTVIALNEILDDETSDRTEDIWLSLYQKSTTEQVSQYQSYHTTLLKNLNSTYQEKYYQNILEQYHQSINTNSQPTDIQKYIEGIDSLRASRINKDDTIMNKFSTKIAPESFLYLINNRQQQYNIYGLTIDQDDFDTFLTDTVPSDKLVTYQIYPFTKKDFKLPKYIQKIKDITIKNYQDIKIISQSLQRLKEIQYDNIPFQINDYWHNDKLDYITRNSKDYKDLQNDLLAITLSQLNDNNLISYFNELLQSEDPKLSASISQRILYYTSYENILNLIVEKGEQTPTLLRAVAKELTLSQDNKTIINITKVLQSYKEITQYSGICATDLLKKLDFSNPNLQELQVGIIESLPLKLFIDCQTIDNKLTQYCLSLANQYLESLQDEQWINSFMNKGFGFNLLHIYHPQKYPFCYNAFKSLMMNYAQDDKQQPIPQDIITTLISIFEYQKLNYKEFFTQIRDTFNNGAITKTQLNYFGELLLKYGSLEIDTRSLNHILRSDLIDDEIITLLINHHTVVKKIMEKSDNNTDFQDKLIAMSKSPNVQAQELCKLLNINTVTTDNSENTGNPNEENNNN